MGSTPDVASWGAGAAAQEVPRPSGLPSCPQVRFSRPESEQARQRRVQSYEFLQKKHAEEPWVHLHYHGLRVSGSGEPVSGRTAVWPHCVASPLLEVQLCPLANTQGEGITSCRQCVLTPVSTLPQREAWAATPVLVQPQRLSVSEPLAGLGVGLLFAYLSSTHCGP